MMKYDGSRIFIVPDCQYQAEKHTNHFLRRNIIFMIQLRHQIDQVQKNGCHCSL